MEPSVSTPSTSSSPDADHEVDVDGAAIAAGALEIGVAHVVAALQRELVGIAERDVARSVLVEQRVVVEQPGLRNRRAVRDQRHFAETARALVGVEQPLEGVGIPSADIFTTRPRSKVTLKPSISVLP